MPALHAPRSRVRWLFVAAIMAAVGGLLWRYPLVRIRRLADSSTVTAFDPRAFAERFWADDLTPAFASAGDAGEVMAAIRRDGAEACRTLGRSVGLSRTCLYLVRGAGTIVEIGATGCRVALDGAAGDVMLATGLVFGTAVRDVTGTVDPASRIDSRELAAAATEINRLVHDRVITPFTSITKVGQQVEFVACGQVQGSLPADRPWKLIPLRMRVVDGPSADAEPTP